MCKLHTLGLGLGNILFKAFSQKAILPGIHNIYNTCAYSTNTCLFSKSYIHLFGGHGHEVFTVRGAVTEVM